MSWFVSNWFFVLLVLGMVWTHLRHGGHGNRHQPSTPPHRHDAVGAHQNRHAVVARSPIAIRVRRDSHAGYNSTGPKEL